MYEFLFEAWIFLMYFKIPYDFTILQSIFTIQVYFAFSVLCQKYVFKNLGAVHYDFDHSGLWFKVYDGLFLFVFFLFIEF
jgi:hypothetical protein